MTRSRGGYVALLAGTLAFVLLAGESFAAETPSGTFPYPLIPFEQIFMLLFLMLGPFKLIGPFAKLTRGADPALTRGIAIRAVVVSLVALVLAAVLGESFLKRYGIPIPVLVFTGGLIFFLVAIRTVLQQFEPRETEAEEATAPSMSTAISPLAFPTIVTPHGIAALIVFLALRPDLSDRLAIVGMAAGILLLDLVAMLLTRHMGRSIWVALQILGAVLGVVQVALGLRIMFQALQLLKLIPA